MKKIFENKYINLIASLELIVSIIAFVFAILNYPHADQILMGIFVISLLTSAAIWYSYIGNSFLGRKDNPKKTKSNYMLMPNLTVNIITTILMIIIFVA